MARKPEYDGPKEIISSKAIRFREAGQASWTDGTLTRFRDGADQSWCQIFDANFGSFGVVIEWEE